MSLIGILLGFLSGVIIAYIILKFIPLGLAFKTQTYIEFEVFILSFAYGIINTLIFSIWPLAKAKKTKPSS